MRGRYILKSNQCCKLISWVQCEQKPYLVADCQQCACSCLSRARQPAQRGMPHGEPWGRLGRTLGGDPGVLAPALGSMMALLGDHTKSHHLSAAGEGVPVPGSPRDNAGWAALASPITLLTWMQSCLPPTLWEEVLVPSTRDRWKRVTQCSTLSPHRKDVPPMATLGPSQGLWQQALQFKIVLLKQPLPWV